MIETESMDAIRDSIASVITLLSEVVANSSPVPYTIENLAWTKYNVFLSILAVIIGALGAYFGYKGYRFSKLTAKNVERLPQSTQVKLCESFLLDLMTRFVRAADIIVYCDESERVPSDNYMSIFTLPDFSDVFYAEIFYDNGKAFILLNDIKARMEHYNHLIRILERHCAEGKVTERDKKVLITQTAKLVSAMTGFLKEVYGGDDSVWQEFYREIVGITKKRADVRGMDDKLMDRIRNIHIVLSKYYKYMKLDLSGFCMPDVVKNMLSSVSDTKVESDDMLSLLAYNGLWEFQYIS